MIDLSDPASINLDRTVCHLGCFHDVAVLRGSYHTIECFGYVYWRIIVHTYGLSAVEAHTMHELGCRTPNILNQNLVVLFVLNLAGPQQGILV